MKFTFCGGSSSFDGSSSGRSPTRSDCSATRAARFADFTELNVAAARTSVPPALAIAEMVTQSAMARVYGACPRSHDSRVSKSALEVAREVGERLRDPERLARAIDLGPKQTA